jgi:acylphosphatase
MKNIQSFIEGNVNLAGYRNIVEGYAINKDLSGFIYNVNKNTVMLMAGGVESAISAFIQDLEATNTNETKIRTIEIDKNIVLPYPFGRVIAGEMREMAERFDKSIGILGEMNGKLDKLNKLDKLDTMNNSIVTLGDKFDLMGNSINDNLNTLPERIAEAMKR